MVRILSAPILALPGQHNNKSNLPYPGDTMKRTAIGACLLMSLAACGSDGTNTTATTNSPAAATPAAGAYDSALAFDKTRYTTINITIDGVKTPVRWYKEVCYVGKPIAMAASQVSHSMRNTGPCRGPSADDDSFSGTRAALLNTGAPAPSGRWCAASGSG